MDFSGIRAKIIDPCGEWDATKQYTAKDFVTYQGSSYIAVYDVTISGTNPATDTDHWQLMASKGDKGDPAVASGDVFMGVATAATKPVALSRDYSYAWLVATEGTYDDMGGLVVLENEIAVLRRYTTAGDLLAWEKKSLGVYIKTTDVPIEPGPGWEPI